jgi:hypothetical protein
MAQEHVGYLMARHEQEMAAAAAASNKAARVAHYELAYRYSLAIAQTGGPNYPTGESVSQVLPAELRTRGVSAATAMPDKDLSETAPVSCAISAVPT